ncbi:MAG: DUF6880 family protein [Puniceicoccaceae bacterium]
MKRRSHFVDYYESEGAARELHSIFDSVERDLIPADPILALKTLQKFIETDSNVIGNADDSNGVMADAYHRACQLLGVASTAEGKPKEAEEVFLALHAFHDYGTRDTMFDEATRILSDEALQRLIMQWRFRMQREDFRKFGGVRVRLGQLAKSIGDPVLHEEASLGGRPIDEYPLVALDVARIYLACGQAEIALTKVPSEQAFRHTAERIKVLIDIQRALGNTAAVAKAYWSEFTRCAFASDARNYLESIAESERPEALQRMREVVLSGDFTPLRRGTYFAEMGDTATAAAIVEASNGQFNGEYYALILDLVKLIEGEHPLAASILYRANLEAILDRGTSKYYPYAVRDAKRLNALAEAITNWKAVTTHEDYWRVIQQKHARKRGFWSQMEP